jgi:hypothetical protein
MIYPERKAFGRKPFYSTKILCYAIIVAFNADGDSSWR